MDWADKVYSRREACALMAGTGGAIALGLVGCAGSTDDTAGTEGNGYASDCDVRDYPVQLTLYADANLQWHMAADASGNDALARYIERYQSQEGRSEVGIDIEYVEPDELLGMAQDGFASGDGLLAIGDDMSVGCDAGTVDGGEGEYLVRDMSYHFSDKMVMVRAAGSTVGLPDAATATGEDASDGTVTRFQQLGAFEGSVALPPASSTEGRAARTALALEGFYDEGADELSAEVADAIVAYDSLDEALKAVASGECDLGFALEATYAYRCTGLESCYRPPSGGVSYRAAALVVSEEPGVMRDFFEFVNTCTD